LSTLKRDENASVIARRTARYARASLSDRKRDRLTHRGYRLTICWPNDRANGTRVDTIDYWNVRYARTRVNASRGCCFRWDFAHQAMSRSPSWKIDPSLFPRSRRKSPMTQNDVWNISESPRSGSRSTELDKSSALHRRSSIMPPFTEAESGVPFRASALRG